MSKYKIKLKYRIRIFRLSVATVFMRIAARIDRRLVEEFAFMWVSRHYDEFQEWGMEHIMEQSYDKTEETA